MLRKFVLTVLMVLAIGTVAHADATMDKIKSRGKVTVGVLAIGGPFGALDPVTKELTGWNPALARKLAEDLGVKIELVEVGTATRVQFLTSGKVDLLIANMELTPDRAENLGYAPTPFYRVDGVALTPRNSGIKTWEDLRDKTVCLAQGSSYARPLAEKYGAKPKGFKTSAESILALKGGQCVAAVHDSTFIYPLVQQGGEWEAYHTPITEELLPGSSVIWTRKGEADTIAAVDRIVQEWHRSGWLIELESKLGLKPPSAALVELHNKFADKK